ncbi:MAG TPA: hypothetical protein VIM16_22175 [Mucilaginibacter sp.]|jgi:membrane protein implicated in regulation of membrane protease activity
MFILLQESSGIGAQQIIIGLFALAFLAIVFLAIRSILLWYWRVDVIVRNQEAQTGLLQRQNDLMEEQTEVLKELKAQIGNYPYDPNDEVLKP